MRNFSYTCFPQEYDPLLEEEGSILLESSRCDTENFQSFFFYRPCRTLLLEKAEDLPRLFAEIEDARQTGRYVAGYLGYEAGSWLFKNTVGSTKPLPMPLARFQVYDEVYIFDHRQGRFLGKTPIADKARVVDYRHSLAKKELSIPSAVYREKIESIHEWIRSGDTYQVNFTDKVEFSFSGSAVGLYRALLERQSVSYAAFLHFGECQVVSCSPELFFRVEDKRIRTKPMKGTAAREHDPEKNEAVKQSLQRDEKNRSENLMIVDLLRNDLGRICEYGSVQVEKLFEVEEYETLLQMTSTVSGRLLEKVTAFDIFQSLFPCGSITGAPKLRTMEIIRELERAPRGIYTGAIGFFSPQQEMAFNVAIRTVVLSSTSGEMGVGGGIVYDSKPESEYQECLLKASFLNLPENDFQLIETILLKGGVYRRLDLHLERLQRSAAALGFQWDRVAIQSKLSSYADALSEKLRYRVRLLLQKDGVVSLSSGVFDGSTSEVIKVALCPERTASSDMLLRHKTTSRAFYDQWKARAATWGFDEILFLNERGEVTEGAISNVFVALDGKLYTPPLACGLLPGVFRRQLLDNEDKAEEKILRLEDLQQAQGVYLCNSLRGLRRAEIDFRVRLEEQSF